MNLFATTSFTCMDKNNVNSDTEETMDQHVLLQELEHLRQAILEQQKKIGRQDKQGIAVFRTYQDLDWEDWHNFNWHEEFNSWIALPLQGKLTPALSEIQKKMQKLAKLSQLDPLTGLANRRSLEQTLALEVERSRRYRQPLSLALLDIDDFKLINDFHGHSYGDEVLIQVGKTIADQTRKTDLVSRLGGEEFVLLLPGTGLVQAKHLAQRILESLRSLMLPVPQSKIQVTPTCSIGLACYKGRQDMDPDRILDAADQAMYQAKQEGKNRLVLAPLIDATRLDSKSLVKHKEKQFLFAGNPDTDPDYGSD